MATSLTGLNEEKRDAEEEAKEDQASQIPELYYLRRDPTWQDASFIVAQATGEVAATASTSTCVLFNPQTSGTHHDKLYLHADGLETPLLINVSAVAIGPEAAFETGSIDLGDMYVGHAYQRTVTLTNIGDVMAQYSLQQHDKMDELFFEPSSGIISTGCSAQMSIAIRPHHPGSWEHALEWRLDVVCFLD